MSSINAATIGTLVNAITGGLTSGQTYDLMRKISEDLDDVFSTVNTGPLKAVNASALLHIDPAHIDSPGDNPQIVTSPGNVAFINWANVFLFNQTITKAEPEFITNGGGGLGHFASAIGGDAYVGANLRWRGGAWGTDAGGVGSIVYLTGGAASIYHWTGAVLIQRYQVNAGGVHQFGVPLSLTNAIAADIVLESQRDIRASNAGSTAALSLIRLDANDIVGLGSDAASASKAGHVGIPQKTTANTPPAGATSDGIICLDKTTGKLCYWVNGGRFAIAAGAAF